MILSRRSDAIPSLSSSRPKHYQHQHKSIKLLTIRFGWDENRNFLSRYYKSYICRWFENKQCSRGKIQPNSGVSKITSHFHFLSASSLETITYPNSIGCHRSQQWTKWLMFIDCLSRGSGFHALRRHLKHDFITCPKVLRLCYSTWDQAHASILGRRCVRVISCFCTQRMDDCQMQRPWIIAEHHNI